MKGVCWEMYMVLLSGGSGKRLWPLSNAMRSKQYLRLLRDEQGNTCSMVQRVWAQLSRTGWADRAVVCAGRDQQEILTSQLGAIEIALEPARRDTFPAVALSCAYLKSKKGASDDDAVCIIPADPYTEPAYFETVGRLPGALAASGAEVVLMGVVPTEPATKYGYILPAEERAGYALVDSFREKPSEQQARDLIAQGALWNCGVFCLRIGDLLGRLSAYGAPTDYEALSRQYERLPAISFDYEVLERAKRLAVVGFSGMWKDLGTWNALTEAMPESTVGRCLMDSSCQGAHLINELDIPLAALGVKDLVVAASPDGILVADKQHSAQVKALADSLRLPPMVEEHSWGSVRVLEREADGPVVRKLTVKAGQWLERSCPERCAVSWMVLQGVGNLRAGHEPRSMRAGDSLRLNPGDSLYMQAQDPMELLEVEWPYGQGGEGLRPLEEGVGLC